MKIRALRTLRGDAGTIRRNGEADLPEAKAKALIARGLAVAADQPVEAAPEQEKPHLPSDGKPATRTGPRTKTTKAKDAEASKEER